MRTRSRSRSRDNSPQREASPAIVEPLLIELQFLEDQFQEDTPPESPMADNRTMAQLLQAPTKGYKDVIVIPEITANNFELKHGLINLVSTSSSTPAISSDVAELKDMVKALLLDKKNQSLALTSSSTHALVKAVESNCVTCGGTHSYQNCPATSGNAYRDNIQEYVSQAAVANYSQGNIGSGGLPGNTVTNLKEDLKGITTRSGVAYEGPKFLLRPNKEP
nr:reverse transcriptase domain-containing protein [Tanacetum cinerariifolium]